MAQKQKQHDVRQDRAGFGLWIRYTCYDCIDGATLLRQPWMSDKQWEEFKKEFFKKHPCSNIKPA